MNQTEAKAVATGVEIVKGIVQSVARGIIEQRADDGSRLCQGIECLGTTKSPVYVDGERRSHELSDRPLFDMVGNMVNLWSK